MPIDTKAKRISAMAAGGYDIVLPDADGTVGDPDQQQLLDGYGGIAFQGNAPEEDWITTTTDWLVSVWLIAEWIIDDWIYGDD